MQSLLQVLFDVIWDENGLEKCTIGQNNAIVTCFLQKDTFHMLPKHNYRLHIPSIYSTFSESHEV